MGKIKNLGKVLRASRNLPPKAKLAIFIIALVVLALVALCKCLAAANDATNDPGNYISLILY